MLLFTYLPTESARPLLMLNVSVSTFEVDNHECSDPFPDFVTKLLLFSLYSYKIHNATIGAWKTSVLFLKSQFKIKLYSERMRGRQNTEDNRMAINFSHLLENPSMAIHQMHKCLQEDRFGIQFRYFLLTSFSRRWCSKRQSSTELRK